MRLKITRTDGGVSIMTLVEGADPEMCVKKWIDLHSGEYVSHESISDEEIPLDRTFRSAWGHDCKVRIDKARDIHMSRIRSSRNEKLKSSDAEFLKTLESSNYQQTPELVAIKAKRQALRDIPQTFDLTQATTPEELKALWPEGL